MFFSLILGLQFVQFLGILTGGLGVHLDLSWGIANSASATGMDFWGVAHELGHVNQVRPGVKWIGTTEVTNNIYTAWAAYNLYTPTKPTTLETHVGEKTSFPSIAGNRYGEMIMNSMVKGNNIMWHFLDSSTASYEKHFRGVIPFWQLELYYQLAGASKGASTLTFDKDMTDEVPATAKTSVSSKSNSTEVDYAHWYAYVVDKTIATDETQISDGQLSLNFVKNVCDAVQEDLTDFFTNAGFLKPANGFITDYSLNKPFLVTQEMIDETKAYIASKGYQKPVSPVINYISANSVSVFKNKLAMTGVTGTGAELITNTNGQFIKVTNSQWQNAVAFETLGANDELVSASIVGTGDTTLANTFVDFPSNAVKVYAVGYDGQKILVYPSSALSSSDVKVNDIFTVYPNPIKNGGKLTIKLKDAKGNLSAALYDMSGRVIVKSNGSLEKIKEQINAELGSAKTGIYILTVNDGEKKYQSKIIKQ